MPTVPRRRWLVLLPALDGADEVPLVVQVPDEDGAVYMSLGGPTAELRAETVSRIRLALAQAQAQALQDRGTW